MKTRAKARRFVVDDSAGGIAAQNQNEPMVQPPTEKPLSEEDTVLALRNYFHQLQFAQCEFEELWYATGQGDRLPGEQALKQLLRRIAGRAELMEVAFVWLRMLREDAEPAGQKPVTAATTTANPTARHAENP
jgi:hypothetical protein